MSKKNKCEKYCRLELNCKIFVALIIVAGLAFFCDNDNSAINPSTQVSKHGQYLIIRLDSSAYIWKTNPFNESIKSIEIRGTIRSNSTGIFYLKLKDSYNNDNFDYQFMLGENTAASIEKFNPNENTWTIIHIFDTIYSEPKPISIVPTIDYKFIGGLFTKSDVVEKGIYRLRIDYFNNQDTDQASALYYDFSDDFELK